jgi:hypothetical protein
LSSNRSNGQVHHDGPEFMGLPKSMRLCVLCLPKVLSNRANFTSRPRHVTVVWLRSGERR